MSLAPSPAMEQPDGRRAGRQYAGDRYGSQPGGRQIGKRKREGTRSRSRSGGAGVEVVDLTSSERAASTSAPAQKTRRKNEAEIEAEVETGAGRRQRGGGGGSKYKYTHGQSPFPDWPHPSASECQTVVRRLSALHGRVAAPKPVLDSSLTTAGCGEVPSVLDALIRTRLSAATTDANSSRAFRGLVSAFGTRRAGPGRGSVDWDAVRCADEQRIYDAIRSGGLAVGKSRDIKAILQLVWEENQRGSGAGAGGGEPAAFADPGDLEAQEEAAEHEHDIDNDIENKEKEEDLAEENADGVLSLEHIRAMPTDRAFHALIKYPGVGPKIASCVLLLCLKRPSFAVDTHVFRLSKWLGWVPAEGATRESTYAHCDARVPDELKYSLHKLLIKHGRQCPECKAEGRRSRTTFDQCPVNDLMVARAPGPIRRKKKL